MIIMSTMTYSVPSSPLARGLCCMSFPISLPSSPVISLLLTEVSATEAFRLQVWTQKLHWIPFNYYKESLQFDFEFREMN